MRNWRKAKLWANIMEGLKQSTELDLEGMRFIHMVSRCSWLHLGDAAKNELQVINALAALLKHHRARIVCTSHHNTREDDAWQHGCVHCLAKVHHVD